MPELSVIVPVYKVENYLHKCVDSILNQTFTDFELLLIDDGSPDNCGQICDEYAQKDARVRVIHKENGGVSEARNVGLENARGNYISFIDPDDWIDSRLFYETLKFLKEKNVDIVCFDCWEVQQGKERTHYKFNEDTIFPAKIALEKILIDEIDNSPCNKLYKKAVWHDIRFPVGRRFEDVATIYKTFCNATQIGYMKKSYYYYLKRSGSAIDLSFDAQRRYECFLGYKERYDFSLKYCKKVSERCKMFAVKAAISCITAKSAGCGDISIEDQKIIDTFVNNIKNVEYLNLKNRLLVYGIKRWPIINKIYGKLSLYSKKIKKF